MLVRWRWLPPGVCNSCEYFGAPRGRWMIFVALGVCKPWRMITMSLMLRNFGMKLIHWIEFLVFDYYACEWFCAVCNFDVAAGYFLHLKTPANFSSPPVTEVSPSGNSPFISWSVQEMGKWFPIVPWSSLVQTFGPLHVVEMFVAIVTGFGILGWLVLEGYMPLLLPRYRNTICH